MNIYYNPSSQSHNTSNHIYTFKSQSIHNNNPKENSLANKKITLNPQSTPKSVGKFKRTNPSLHHTKPVSPHLQKSNYQQLDTSKIKYETHKQSVNYDDKTTQLDIMTNLTNSRQTNRTVQGKTILYVSPSKQHKIFLTDRNSMTREKYQSPTNQDLKSLKSFKSGKSSNKGSKGDNENYSLYWKRKAHEYLQNNFRLSQQVSELKRQLSKYEQSIPQGSILNSQLTFSQAQSETRIQKSVPIHIVQLQQKRYIQQINQLQITNRLKDSVIQNFQTKIIQLTQQIKGQHQKSQLLQKMRRQIQQLQNRNKRLSKQHQQTIKINKIYQTQKALLQAKQKTILQINPIDKQFGQYKFQKQLEKLRYRSLQ